MSAPGQGVVDAGVGGVVVVGVVVGVVVVGTVVTTVGMLGNGRGVVDSRLGRRNHTNDPVAMTIASTDSTAILSSLRSRGGL